MNTIKLTAAAVIAVTLAACGSKDDRESVPGHAHQDQSSLSGAAAPVQQAQQAAPQPQTVVVQQPAQSHSGMTDMLLGGAIGYMLGNSGGSNHRPVEQTVVNKTIVNKTIVREVPAPTPAHAAPKFTPPPAPKPAPAPTPSFKPANTGYSHSSMSSSRPSPSSYGRK